MTLSPWKAGTICLFGRNDVLGHTAAAWGIG